MNEPSLPSAFRDYHSRTPDVAYEQMEISLKHHTRTAVQQGKSKWKCGQNELREFVDQTIVALASTEGGNKDTLVPESIKYPSA
ncbi:hypothetical protein VZT92_024232 [Zoarces viviparus]|uniref:Uncharacterized protein n=1 Tax=Zoarces viviparus TaxID=48416 RepID=A0AAW1E0Z8_ZOAVI